MMTGMRAASILTSVALCLAVSSAVGRGDVVRLKNGGEVRGRLLTAVTRTPGETIAIETLAGTRIELDGDSVILVALRPLKVEIYETRAVTVENTVEARWALSEWCRLQRLPDQRKRQLRLIVELDPTHRKAHYGLGHTLRDGRWMTRDQHMRARGLVRFRGRYVTPQMREDLLRGKAGQEVYKNWFGQIRVWHKWLTSRDAKQRARGIEQLSAITDPVAVGPLLKILRPDDNPQVRVLLAGVLGKIPGRVPVDPLIGLALRDAGYEVRGAARAAIGDDRQQLAVPALAGALQDRSNIVVRRAAAMLGGIGDVRVVPPLIEALVTRHLYKVRVPGSKHPSFSFARDGTPVNPLAAQGFGVPPQVLLGMRTGQFPYGVVILPSEFSKRQTHVITVAIDHSNSEVLGALNKLTKVGFGYDKRSWRLWWLAYSQGAAGGSAGGSGEGR